MSVCQLLFSDLCYLEGTLQDWVRLVPLFSNRQTKSPLVALKRFFQVWRNCNGHFYNVSMGLLVGYSEVGTCWMGWIVTLFLVPVDPTLQVSQGLTVNILEWKKNNAWPTLSSEALFFPYFLWPLWRHHLCLPFTKSRLNIVLLLIWPQLFEQDTFVELSFFGWWILPVAVKILVAKDAWCTFNFHATKLSPTFRGCTLPCGDFISRSKNWRGFCYMQFWKTFVIYMQMMFFKQLSNSACFPARHWQWYTSIVNHITTVRFTFETGFSKLVFLGIFLLVSPACFVKLNLHMNA